MTSEADTDIVFIPFQVWCRLGHVDDGWDHHGPAAVALLGIVTIKVASPARVALVGYPLDEATASAHSRWRLPRHLLVVDVPIVANIVVIRAAFFKNLLKDHFWEVALAVQELAATQIAVKVLMRRNLKQVIKVMPGKCWLERGGSLIGCSLGFGDARSIIRIELAEGHIFCLLS